jgi:hypothetical protein
MRIQGLRDRFSRPGTAKALGRYGLRALYLLITVQFVGCYLFLVHPYLHLDRFGHGLERLPFQTRLLLAPLFRWAEESGFVAHYAQRLSTGHYFFFPRGIGRGGLVELYMDVPCVLAAGWVAARLYHAASARRLLGWAVYPLFLVLCVSTYILHAMQNFRFVYDLPSLMFFALGLYVIYFRKPTLWLVALFCVATWNRETTLFLIPFFLLSACVRPSQRSSEPHVDRSGSPNGERLAFTPKENLVDRFDWRRALTPEVLIPALAMAAYWTAWHLFVFHLFRNNVSEYYPRVSLNLYTFRHLRYYPQLFSAFGFLLPILIVFRHHVRDAQLRVWLWTLPAWYLVMGIWGILVETRIFGELLPFLAATSVLVAEEAVVAAMRRRGWSEDDEQSGMPRLVRAA